MGVSSDSNVYLGVDSTKQRIMIWCIRFQVDVAINFSCCAYRLAVICADGERARSAREVAQESYAHRAPAICSNPPRAGVESRKGRTPEEDKPKEDFLPQGSARLSTPLGFACMWLLLRGRCRLSFAAEGSDGAWPGARYGLVHRRLCPWKLLLRLHRVQGFAAPRSLLYRPLTPFPIRTDSLCPTFTLLYCIRQKHFQSSVLWLPGVLSTTSLSVLFLLSPR